MLQRENSLMMFKDIQFNVARMKMEECLMQLAESTSSVDESMAQLSYFQLLFARYLSAFSKPGDDPKRGALDWSKIGVPPKEMLIDYEQLPLVSASTEALVDPQHVSQTVVSITTQLVTSNTTSMAAGDSRAVAMVPPKEIELAKTLRSAAEGLTEQLLGLSLDELQGLKKAELLDKLAVVKLNGGLGTTMGCKGPKSLIEVRDDMTFLDLTVRQIEWLNETFGCDVPLVLMNSFYTDQETERIIKKYTTIDILTFNQHQFPRIEKETMLPLAMAYSKDSNSNSNTDSNYHTKDFWYPPGHGDLYDCLRTSGLLDGLVGKGKEYLFVSNIDNLGATVDMRILSYFHQQTACDFMMELTAKSPADVKGGTLVSYEGQPRLLEVAQVPQAHLEEFKSVRKFALFNTNNLWIRLSAIQQITTDQLLDMEIIANEKTVTIGSNKPTKIIQLEQAVGAAIRHFKGAVGIKVPRTRFLPVKTCSDLLLVKSNLYSLAHGAMVVNPNRSFQSSIPVVKLGDDNFRSLAQFEHRFQSIPNIIELDHLTVSGDVMFGANVTLKGSVIIIANHGERIDIPCGAIIENKIISGNLRIINH